MPQKTIKKGSLSYSYKQVFAKCMDYFHGDELAASTWINKYALKGEDEKFLESSPDDMHWRMAIAFAGKEKDYQNSIKKINTGHLSTYGQVREALNEKKILHYFKDFKYIIPQGSVMSSLGNPNHFASLSNCVVLPEIYDSYGGIFFTDQQLAQLFKRRCGAGIDISSLRPSGMAVSNVAGTTSGAVSFMERFSNTTREVGQNGRRGALMITMDIAHPDIEEFIKIKQDLNKITGANISIRLSDEFMKAVVSGSDFTLRWPIDAVEPRIERIIKSNELWNTIVKCAHNTAEPGLIFWDRQHNYSTSSVYPGFKNVSTNPCSEIAMQGGDSCRLMALNLFSFVEEPFSAQAKFDYKKFYEAAYEAQRLMDDLVDLELETIEKILAKIESEPDPDYIKAVEVKTWMLLYDNGKKGRRTGLGFTALGDAFAAMGIKYDSSEALTESEKIMKTKCEAEFDSSIDMAIERGRFADFDSEIERRSGFIEMLSKELPQVYNRMMKFGRRNISLSSVAPTGSLSILAQCASGIEPVFNLSYKRRKKVNPTDKNVHINFVDDTGDSWQEFMVHHPKLQTWMEVSRETDISKSPYYGSTAADIDWRKRIDLQSVVQKYTTHSISSTINLPFDVSVGEVELIYMEAWKKGLKGITVYREGSRSGVLISSGSAKTNVEIIETIPPKRPKMLDAGVIRFMNHREQWLSVVGLLEGRPYEIFTGNQESFSIPLWVKTGWVIKNRLDDGKKRYDFQYLNREGQEVTIEGLSRSFNKEYWNYAKLISGILRHGMPLTKVVDLVEKLNLYEDNINTWKSGVERALKKFIPDGTRALESLCEECGIKNSLFYEEGCVKCSNCGHSKCG